MFSLSNKRTRWPLLIALLILLVGLPTAFYLNSRAKRVEAAWWNPSWAFRKRVALTNSNGSALTDFQVSFTLDTAALITANKLQSDCDDLRITDHLGRELPFWIEENNPGCNNAATKIWTKVPTIPTSGGSLYVYYGNSAATNQEKPNDVFAFFDGFNAATLNTNVWTNTGAYSLASGAITITTGSVYSKTAILANNQNYVYEMRSKWAAGGSQWSGLDIASTQNVLGSNSGASALSFFMHLNGTPTLGAYASSGSSGYNVASATTQFTTTTNTYEVIGFSHNPTTLSYYRNQTLTNSYSDNASFAPFLWLGYFMGSGSGTTDISDTTVDWVLVRKYATTSPVATPATEETTPGPVAVWKLDEGGGTVIKDSSGNNRSGTLSNATWSSTDCVNENCLQFNGSTGYADTGFDYSLTYDASTSFSVWIKPATTNTGGKVKTILGKVSYEYILSQLDGTLMFRQWNAAGADTIVLQTGSILNANQWYQVTVVYDGSAHTTSMYVNGVLQTSAANLQSSFIDRTETLKIGYGYGWSSSPTPYFSGKIDEVKIYPFALTATQIKKELTLGSAVTVGIENQGSLGTGLVGYWPMDETTGTSIADFSGNGATATLTNAQETGASETEGTTTTVVDADNSTLSTYDDAYNGMIMSITGGSGCGIGSGNDNRIRFITDYVGSTKTFTVGSAYAAETDNCTFQILHQSRGKFGSGLYMDGVNHEGGNDVIELTDIRFDSDDPWSYSVWHKIPTGSTVSWNSFFGGNQTGYGGYWQYHGSGLMWYQDYYNSTVYGINDGVVNFGDELPYDQWFMLTLTYTPTDLTHGYSRIYVNGRLVHSRSVTLSSRTTYFTVDKLSGAGGRTFEGYMDEARLYNRVLAESEIVDLYNWAPKPKAYYPLDEGTGTTTIDKGGNTNVAVSNTTWTGGKFGQALHFNGTSAYVDIPNVSHPFAFTKMAWVKVNVAGCTNESRCSILAPYFEILSDGRLQMYSYELNPSGWHSSTVNPTDNVWTHVAVSYDGINLYLFVNGKQTQKVAAQQPRYFGDTTSLGTYGTIRWFAGDIDEVKIYDYARTPQQIVQDMNAGHPVGGSPVGSQLAYWKLDEGNGTQVHDAASGSVGTISAPLWNTSCIVNGCLQFDGTDRSVTGTLPASIANTSFSITGWLFLDSDAPASSSWFTAGAGGTNSWIHLRMYSTGVMRFGFYSNDLDTPTGTFTRNAWHHVAYTYNATTKVRAIWLDGRQVQSAVSTSDYLGTQAYLIGKFSTEYWKGKIDEVKIYSSALTAEQIAIDSNNGAAMRYGASTPESADLADGSGSGPILALDFEEMSGSTVKDSSGNNFAGTLGGAPTWNATGKNGAAMEFHASTDRLTVADNDALDLTNAYTLETWAKFTEVGARHHTLIDKGSGSSYGWRLIASSGQQLMLQIKNNAAWYTGANIIGLSPNTWYHIVYTWDGTNAYLYVNGQSVATSTIAQHTLVANADPLIIGNWGTAGSDGNAHNGLLDQVRIYNYARTPDQVIYDYNRGKPVAHWKLDECQGTTISDASGNNLNGTWSGPTGTQTSAGTCTTSGTAWGNGVNGKYSSSLNFDGTDDYVEIADNTALNFVNKPYTVCAWVNKSTSFGTGGAGLKRIFDKTAAGTNDGYGLDIADDTIRMLGNPSMAKAFTLTTNTWYHVCAVSNAGTGTIYVNGQSIGSGSYASPNAYTSPARIGKASTLSALFIGKIDDVQIYNYALSLDQIGKVFNQGSAVRFGE